MKRNSKQTGIADAINYDKLSKLIYYKVHFETSQIDDLTTALSYETIVSICTKHLGIDESELKSKKGTEYASHRHIFIGALFLYLNIAPRPIGKMIGRFTKTVYYSAIVLSYYLETWTRDYDKYLQPAVKNILMECEQQSGGRFFKNVHPELTPLSKCNEIQITRELGNPYYSIDQILDVPIREFKWFNENISMQVFSPDGKNQYSVYSKYRNSDNYLYIMQSFGYRFVGSNEYVTQLNQQSAKISMQTLERLKSFLSSPSVDEDKCSGCPFKENKTCPLEVQQSGFCPKRKNNQTSVVFGDEKMSYLFSKVSNFKETSIKSYIKN